MSSTSKKHSNFVNEPMGEKRVQELPGIGKTLGTRLENKGIDKAYMVQGQYLTKGKDEGRFKDWLMSTSGANSKQQADCHRGVKEWSDNNQ